MHWLVSLRVTLLTQPLGSMITKIDPWRLAIIRNNDGWTPCVNHYLASTAVGRHCLGKYVVAANFGNAAGEESGEFGIRNEETITIEIVCSAAVKDDFDGCWSCDVLFGYGACNHLHHRTSMENEKCLMARPASPHAT